MCAGVDTLSVAAAELPPQTATEIRRRHRNSSSNAATALAARSFCRQHSQGPNVISANKESESRTNHPAVACSYLAGGGCSKFCLNLPGLEGDKGETGRGTGTLDTSCRDAQKLWTARTCGPLGDRLRQDETDRRQAEAQHSGHLGSRHCAGRSGGTASDRGGDGPKAGSSAAQWTPRAATQWATRPGLLASDECEG